MPTNKKTDVTENYPWLVYSQDIDATENSGGGGGGGGTEYEIKCYTLLGMPATLTEITSIVYPVSIVETIDPDLQATVKKFAIDKSGSPLTKAAAGELVGVDMSDMVDSNDDRMCIYRNAADAENLLTKDACIESATYVEVDTTDFLVYVMPSFNASFVERAM